MSSQRPTHRDYDLTREFTRFRSQLVDRLFGAAAILALLYTPVMILRVLDVGWHFQLGVQAVVMALGISFYALRRRMSMAWKSGVSVGVAYLLGLIGIFNQGMMGTGYWWTLIAVVLAATLYSMRAGVLLAAGAAALLVFVAFGFVTARLTPPVDLNVFMATPSAWVGFIVVALFAPLALLYAISNYQSMTTRFAEEIELQRRQLAALLGHDPLTGLAQSALAMERLETQLALAHGAGRHVALLFIDLDGFKGVNDNHGHAAGDALLAAIAQRLRAAVRESDTVARVGGDEFLVILGRIEQQSTALAIAEQLIGAIAQPVAFQQQTLTVGASIGIALFPDHAHDAEGLRRAADAAMYEAKREGKNHFRFARAAAAAQPRAA